MVMGKIHTVQSNYLPIAKQKQIVKPVARQSFGSANPTKVVTEEVISKVNNSFGPIEKCVKWISELLDTKDGEIQNQVINGAFTTTLAPLMIAWNPFSKQDEKTKKYTALRQPISAGIAVTGGLGMTMAIDYYMNKLSSEGFLFYDARISPTKAYLKSQFKKAYQSATDKQAFLNSCNPEGYDGKIGETRGGKPVGKYKKACIDGYVKKVQEERQSFFTRLITEDPESLIKNSSDVLKGKYPGISTVEELKEYIDNNNLHKCSLENFMNEHFNQNAKKKLSSIKATDFLERLGMKGVDEQELAKVTSLARQENKNITLEQLFKKLGYIKDNSEGGITGLDLMKKSVADALSELQGQNKLGKVVTAQKDASGKALTVGMHKLSEFGKNIISRKASLVEKNFKNFNKYSGIFFNLFMTMITCSVLNWAYPRIVETLFPSLLDKPKPVSKKEGGSK